MLLQKRFRVHGIFVGRVRSAFQQDGGRGNPARRKVFRHAFGDAIGSRYNDHRGTVRFEVPAGVYSSQIRIVAERGVRPGSGDEHRAAQNHKNVGIALIPVGREHFRHHPDQGSKRDHQDGDCDDCAAGSSKGNELWAGHQLPFAIHFLDQLEELLRVILRIELSFEPGTRFVTDRVQFEKPKN